MNVIIYKIIVFLKFNIFNVVIPIPEINFKIIKNIFILI